MKKKIVTLLLVAAMTGTMVVGCGSKADDKTADTKTEQTDDKKDTEEKKELADDEYQYVSAADTVIADGVHVLENGKIIPKEELQIQSGARSSHWRTIPW